MTAPAAQAQAQEGDFVLPGVADGGDGASMPRSPKPPGTSTPFPAEQRGGDLVFDVLRVHVVHNSTWASVGPAGVLDGLGRPER